LREAKAASTWQNLYLGPYAAFATAAEKTEKTDK
jgi:hypothetical protein